MILVVDDDKAIQVSLKLLLEKAGHKVVCASSPEEANRVIQTELPKLIILDLNFDNNTTGEEGLAYLKTIKTRIPSLPIILITAWASISLAVEGVKNGAFDFVSKPWENSVLLNTIKTALTLTNQEKTSVTNNRSQLDKKFNFKNIIGQSKELSAILQTVSRVSKTNAPVLILGESGTGKELIAEAIHENSERENMPFIKVNLGGISSSLFESEMFGHKKGAFTDAYNDRKGSFEVANGGTIFLDEIGDLDFNSQVKLLRVLQEKTYQVLGESKIRKTDVRIVCATNCNLPKMVQEGSFREDLLYRINLITINLPSLKNRNDDIPLLAAHFLKNISDTYNSSKITIHEEAMQWLRRQPFPGNIREFKNLVERTWILSGKEQLEIKDFENALQQNVAFLGESELVPTNMTLDQMEREMIEKSLEIHKGNLTKVAASLGLSRGSLYRRLDKHQISYSKDI